MEEFDYIMEIKQKLNQDLCDEQAEMESKNQGLYREQEQLKEKNNDLEVDISRNKLEQKYLEGKYEETKEKLGRLDRLLDGLEKIKKFIKSYLPFAPLFEEFANKVESGQKKLEEGNSISSD